MKRASWLLLFGLLLVGAAFTFVGLMRKVERDQLQALEDNMLDTAKALAPVTISQLTSDVAVEKLWQNLVTTQNVTGSRIRVLNRNRDLVADSLSLKKQEQAQLRFRPEIQAAFTGNYGAYTRLADENPNSLALFVAWPVYYDDEIVGVVYVSHTTDDILQQIGVMRRTANRSLVVLSALVFLGALLLTGNIRRTLGRLGALTQTVSEPEPKNINISGNDEVAEIGENFNRLIDSLRSKVAQLEEEKSKTKLFLEDVAHELKTPLTGLLGSVEALQEADGEDVDEGRLLSNVEKEAQRLSELTSKLLELQKLDYLELKEERFDLLSVVETVVDSYERFAAKKEVALVLESPDQVSCLGDPSRLQRVVENLLENAIRCSPSGSTITARITLESHEKARFDLEDEGPGPPEPSAFQRHHQGQGHHGSLGLGLSIAQEILNKHHQSLQVRPALDKGSVFSFHLPLAEQKTT